MRRAEYYYELFEKYDEGLLHLDAFEKSINEARKEVIEECARIVDECGQFLDGKTLLTLIKYLK